MERLRRAIAYSAVKSISYADVMQHIDFIAAEYGGAASPEPPNLDCGRLARAIDEHIESDCPRDTACDGTCADSIAERYGGAAPDRLPSVEALAAAMWDALSDNNVLRIDADSPKELHDIAAAVWASLHEEPTEATDE